MKIPYSKPYKSRNEKEYINDAIHRGSISGDGHYTKLVSELLENSYGIKKVFMTTSATHGLELAAQIIGIQAGDEVIMPAFTFSSTANSIMLMGAKPVFADILQDSLNISADDIKNKLTKRTKAIIPVHYAGVSCEMDKIMDIARNNNIYVIEDAAQGVCSKYREKYLGTIGHLGVFSFHGTKNYTCGEGGALCINSDDKAMIEKAEIIRQKGTDRAKFLKGEVSSYSWVNKGSSYSPSDILMAFLYSQLEEADFITNKRRLIYEYYSQTLSDVVERKGIKISSIPKDCSSNYHIFFLIFDDEKRRSYVMNELNRSGIDACSHYVPLHSSKMGWALGYKASDLPITQKLSRTILRLPLYPDMSKEEMEYVADSVMNIIGEL